MRRIECVALKCYDMSCPALLCYAMHRMYCTEMLRYAILLCYSLLRIECIALKCCDMPYCCAIYSLPHTECNALQYTAMLCYAMRRIECTDSVLYCYAMLNATLCDASNVLHCNTIYDHACDAALTTCAASRCPPTNATWRG